MYAFDGSLLGVTIRRDSADWGLCGEACCGVKEFLLDFYLVIGCCGVVITYVFFFFNDTATTEIYTSLFVGSVRCV